MDTTVLSPQQKEAFELYLQRKNIFITGAGGCGKTYFIRCIYQHAKDNHQEIQVCATTGCSALLLQCNAMTIHSWAGIGHGNGELDTYIYRIKTRPFLRNRWLRTKVLIIDELSMLSKKTLNLLDTIGREIRGNLNPFGGIQVIGSGDFFQLPPVGSRDDPDTIAFAFESSRWNQIFPYEIEFKTNYRQNDKSFLSILSQIRLGRLTRSKYNLLLKYINREKDTTHIQPAKLMPIKSKVERINKKELDKLDNEGMTFNIEYLDNPKKNRISNDKIKKELEFMEKYSNIERTLTLKIGAQVMCTRNLSIEMGIVNGTIARVEDFIWDSEIKEYKIKLKLSSGQYFSMPKTTFLCEKFSADDEIGIRQYPLILAWAVSIHKSQGLTLECAEMDIGKSIFEYGQSYVALSRVKSLEGLYLTEFEPTRIRVNPKVRDYYSRFTDKSDNSSLAQV